MPKFLNTFARDLIYQLETPNMRPLLKAVMGAYALLHFVNRLEGSPGHGRNSGLAETFKELKGLFPEGGEDIFQDFMQRLRENPEQGRLDVITAVAALRGAVNITRLLMQSCIAIATSDGKLPTEEVKAIESIAIALGEPRWVHLSWMPADELGLSCRAS